jgi:hypothetical protein
MCGLVDAWWRYGFEFALEDCQHAMPSGSGGSRDGERSSTREHVDDVLGALMIIDHDRVEQVLVTPADVLSVAAQPG